MTSLVGFFNYLTMVLSLSLLGDRQLTSMLGRALTTRLCGFLRELQHSGSRDYLSAWLGRTSIGAVILHAIVFYPAVSLVFASSVMALVDLLQRVGCVSSVRLEEGALISATLLQLQAAHKVLRRTFYLGSHYGGGGGGLLAVTMTKERNELLIEVGCPKQRKQQHQQQQHKQQQQQQHTPLETPVTEEERDWLPVEFLAKPGSLYAPPKAVSPSFHLPRLDWLMCFLSSSMTKKDQQYPPWFWVLLISILEWNNADIVMGLLHPTLNEALADRLLSTEDKGSLAVRVSLRQYRYYAGDETSEGGRKGGVHSHQYWCTSNSVSVAVVESMTLCDLYASLDAVDDAGDWRRTHRKGAARKAPSPDTAQDIIARTILKFKVDRQRADLSCDQ